jgi:hypothetical protein
MQKKYCNNSNIQIMQKLLKKDVSIFKLIIKNHILLLSSNNSEKYIKYLVKHNWSYISNYILKYNALYKSICNTYLTRSKYLFKYFKWLYKYTSVLTQPSDFIYILFLTLKKKDLINIIIEFIDIFGNNTKCNSVLSSV